MDTFKINDVEVGGENPTYFIADIAANHDGELQKAIDLIWLAKEKGADAAKFQHFKAETIVSDFAFNNLTEVRTHQSAWKNTVFEVYKAASVSASWTPILKKTCDEAGIAFFTSPYDPEIVDEIDPFVPAHKIGSGDITWIEIVEHIAKKNKPYILATGASSLADVKNAVAAATKHNKQIALLQCNTNYTASLENFKYINLNVLKQYRKLFPEMVLGLSDHTPGNATVLGAVALGARVIEKHLTDDKSREGPDHKFSMDGDDWYEMVQRTRELELSMGNGIKIVEKNEENSAIVQRRSLCAKTNLSVGHVIKKEDLVSLRPCPPDAFPPFAINELVGRTITKDISEGEPITKTKVSG